MAFPILCRRAVCLGLPDCSFDLSAPAVSPSDVQLGAHAARRAICSAADAGGLPTPTKRSPHTLRLLCRSRRALCGPDPVLAGRRQTAIPLGCECPRSRPCRALERADGTSVHRDDCPSDVGGGRRQQKTATRPNSSGSPYLQSGMFFDCLARTSSGSPASASISRTRSVAIRTGISPLMRTPAGPYSSASVFTMPASPGKRPLEMARFGRGARTDAANTNTRDAPVPVG